MKRITATTLIQIEGVRQIIEDQRRTYSEIHAIFGIRMTVFPQRFNCENSFVVVLYHIS